jgi:transcriptional regulator with XRE-family HTH domain
MPRKKYGETSFGERLASLRKARGFTQVQLARTANTTQRAISYYENEAGFPPVPAVLELARALRVGTDELLGSSGAPRREALTASGKPSDRANRGARA